jgi:hypothetical protein
LPASALSASVGRDAGGNVAHRVSSGSDCNFRSKSIGLLQEVAKHDGLDRGPDAVISDVLGFDAARLGNDFGDRQAAEAPLARPHSAATERLCLIGAVATHFDTPAYLTSRYLLASADHNAVGFGNTVLVVGPIEGVQQSPDMCVASELALEGFRALCKARH